MDKTLAFCYGYYFKMITKSKLLISNWWKILMVRIKINRVLSTSNSIIHFDHDSNFGRNDYKLQIKVVNRRVGTGDWRRVGSGDWRGSRGVYACIIVLMRAALPSEGGNAGEMWGVIWSNVRPKRQRVSERIPSDTGPGTPLSLSLVFIHPEKN